MTGCALRVQPSGIYLNSTDIKIFMDLSKTVIVLFELCDSKLKKEKRKLFYIKR